MVYGNGMNGLQDNVKNLIRVLGLAGRDAQPIVVRSG